MSRLSPEAEQLVRAGRAELRPDDTDRERVFQGLLARTAGLPASGGGHGEPSHAPAASKLTLINASGVLAGLAAVGAGVLWAVRPEPAPAPAALPPTPVITQPAPASPPALPELTTIPETSVVAEPPSVDLPPEASAAKSASVSADRARPSRRAAPRSEDHLAQEVALLSRASSELHAARPAAALVALDEHARRFPSGVLAQERAAARARALCALGRTREAQAELAKLTPGSAHAARAAQACAASPAREK